MGYLWYDLKKQRQGQIIEIDVATAVNVKLMNYENFSSFYMSKLIKAERLLKN